MVVERMDLRVTRINKLRPIHKPPMLLVYCIFADCLDFFATHLARLCLAFLSAVFDRSCAVLLLVLLLMVMVMVC